MEQLIKELQRLGILRSRAIIAAFRAIDRKDFVQPDQVASAYNNEPLPIGYGQTISQPYTVAFMLELLEARAGQRILDVGTGSGWTTTLLGHVVGTKGYVFGTELIPELVALGKSNAAKYHLPNISIEQAGNVFGLPDQAPFDRILVSATAPTLPQELLTQLAIGGIMVIPVKNSIVKVKKLSISDITQETYAGFAFVPLIKKT